MKKPETGTSVVLYDGLRALVCDGGVIVYGETQMHRTGMVAISGATVRQFERPQFDEVRWMVVFPKPADPDESTM